MRLLICAALLFFFVLGVSGICKDSPIPNAFQFVGRGQVCNGASPDTGCTKCCKNFLSCLPSPNSTETNITYTCQEVAQNSTCDPNQWGAAGINPCGSSMECLLIDGSDNDYRCLFPYALENGAQCVTGQQCLSKVCSTPQAASKAGSGSKPSSNNTKTCAPTSSVPSPACLLQTDCPPGYWCNITGEVGTCSLPIKSGGDCSAIAPIYDELLSTPNFVCAAGSGCLKTPQKKTGDVKYVCTNYYESNKKSSVCYASQWWNCEFGFYCNITDQENQQGTCQITNQNGAIGDQCTHFPWSSQDMQECYWGTGCSCFSLTSSSKGKCQRMYNTNCQIQLENLVNCIKKNKCPHDAFQLLGGNPSPFADSTIFGSCIQTKCSSDHANLIQCQNDINDPKSAVSSAYVPKTFPNNDTDKYENGLQGWEIGLIIVGVAVTIIIIVVIVVAFVRQRQAPGYEPL